MASRLEIVLAVVVFAAVFAVAFIIFAQDKPQGIPACSFKAVEENVLFCSEEISPADFLSAFKDKNEFLVVISDNGKSSGVGFSGNTLILFQSVLVANGKKAIAVARELDGKGNLLKCQTNYGSSGINESISAEKCAELFSEGKELKGIVFIENADSSLKQPMVVLEKNSISLRPGKDSELQSMGFLVLNAMFPDSEEKIRQMNDFLKTAR